LRVVVVAVHCCPFYNIQGAVYNTDDLKEKNMLTINADENEDGKMSFNSVPDDVCFVLFS
jgi:hypothetical protein